MLRSSSQNGTQSHEGSVSHLIKDGQKTAFQLTDAKVRTLGYPNGVFYRDPTFNGRDLFAYMQRIQPTKIPRECQTAMKPTSINFSNQLERMISIDVNSITNDSKQTIQFNTGISRERSQTTTSSWSRSHAFQATYTVTAGIDVVFASGQTSVSAAYTFEYTKTEERSRTTTLGSQVGTIVPVLPQHSVKVQLLAAEGSGRAEVVYDAFLQRQVAVDWQQRGTLPAVINVLKFHKLPTTIKVPQILRISNYGRTHTKVSQWGPK